MRSRQEQLLKARSSAALMKASSNVSGLSLVLPPPNPFWSLNHLAPFSAIPHAKTEFIHAGLQGYEAQDSKIGKLPS